MISVGVCRGLVLEVQSLVIADLAGMTDFERGRA
jgi:hypothetical protein